MKASLFVWLAAFAVFSTAGCITTGGYDPSTGMIYGPSMRNPFTKDHHAHGVHDCSLCAAEASGYGYGAYGSGPACVATGMACDGAIYGGIGHDASGFGGCSSCAGTPLHSGCSSCGQPPVVNTHSGCSTCGQAHSFSGTSFTNETIVGDGFVSDNSYVVDESHSDGNCPHCQQQHSSNPIFSPEMVPGSPTPAPPADLTDEPNTRIAPTPEVPGQVSTRPMMIPTMPASAGPRQVHWVPNALK